MANETCVLKKIKSEKFEHALKVLDSKIQYLDHQTKGIVRPLLSETNNAEELVGEAKSDSPLSLQAVEQLFLHFEKQSRRKKLLLYLRTLLNLDNAMLVLELLTDDQLFVFSEEEIQYILDIDLFKKAA